MGDFLDGILTQLRTTFDPTLIGTKLATLLSQFMIAAVTFAAFYLFWRLLNRALTPVLSRTRVDQTATSFILTITKYTVLIVGAVSALNAIGINTGAFIASLGIAGLTIGFAARDALSNIISGVFIFWDRPFVIGDLIEVENQYGRVEAITLRSTRVVTTDGRMLAIPNTTMVNTIVASYTNFPHLRIDVEVTIGVNEELERARQILLDLVQHDPDYMDDRTPQVVVTQLNDYNVALELRAWLDDERKHVQKRLALREAIYKAFTNAGIDMPFETIQLQPLEIRKEAA